MKTLLLHWSAFAVVAGLIGISFSGCVAGSGPYGYSGDGEIDYYEPVGAVVGGWGPGYHVGPYHDGDDHPHNPAGSPGSAPRPYKPAPGSRPVPSIPHSAPSHSGGGGGSHGGGRK